MLSSLVNGLRHLRGSSIWIAAVQGIQRISIKHGDNLLQYASSFFDQIPLSESSLITLCRLVYLLSLDKESMIRTSKESRLLAQRIISYLSSIEGVTSNRPSLASYLICSSNRSIEQEREFYSYTLLTDEAMTCEVLIAAAAALDPEYFCEYVLSQLSEGCTDASIELLRAIRDDHIITLEHLNDALSALSPKALNENDVKALEAAISNSDKVTPLLPVLDRLVSSIIKDFGDNLVTYATSEANPIFQILTRSTIYTEVRSPALVPGPWLIIKLLLAAVHSVKLPNKIWMGKLLQRLFCVVPLLEGKLSRLLGLCALLHIKSSYQADRDLHLAIQAIHIKELNFFFTKAEEWMQRSSSSLVLQTLSFQSTVFLMEYAKIQEITKITQRMAPILAVAASIHQQTGTFLNILTIFAAELEELQASGILSTILDLQTAGILGVSELLRILDEANSPTLVSGTILELNTKANSQQQPNYLASIEKAKYGSKYGSRLLSCPVFHDMVVLHKPLSTNVISFYRFTEALGVYIFTFCFSQLNEHASFSASPSLEISRGGDERERGVDISSPSSVQLSLSIILDTYLSAGDHLFAIVSTIYDFSSNFSRNTQVSNSPVLLPLILERFKGYGIPPDLFGYNEFFIVLATARILVCLYLQDIESSTVKIKQNLAKSKGSSIVLLMGLCLLSNTHEFVKFSPDYSSFINFILPSCINVQLGKRKNRDSATNRGTLSPRHGSTTIYEDSKQLMPRTYITYQEMIYLVKTHHDPLHYHRIGYVLSHVLYKALEGRLCDSTAIGDCLMLMMYMATDVLYTPDSTCEDLGSTFNAEKAQALLLALASSHIGPEVVCNTIIIFLFSHNLPFSISAESRGLFELPLWNAKLLATKLLSSVITMISKSQLLVILSSNKVYFRKLIVFLIEMMSLPLHTHTEDILKLFVDITNCILETQVTRTPLEMSAVENIMSFSDENLILLDNTRKEIDLPTNPPSTKSYTHFVYQTSSNYALFSHFGALDSNLSIETHYNYISAIVAAHIKSFRERLTSGQMSLLSYDLKEVYKFLSSRRAGLLTIPSMMPGLRFLDHMPALVVAENLCALFRSENASLYQSSYIYWYECFLVDLLFSMPNNFACKLFNDYDQIKRVIGQQIQERKIKNMPFSDCHELLTHYIHTYNIITCRRLLQISSSLFVERVSSLHTTFSTATGLSSATHSRVNSTFQPLTSPKQLSPLPTNKDSELPDSDKKFQVELDIVLPSFGDIYEWAKDRSALSVRTIMHFGHCVSAVSGSIALAMIVSCEQNNQSTAASVLLKCYADICNAAQYYRQITKEDEAYAAAERIGMIAPKSGANTCQLEQCCKTLLYYISNKSQLLFMDTTAYVLEALLALPVRHVESSTVQILLHLLGHIILNSGFPRVGKTVIESPYLHLGTGNISKIADSPSYSSLYKASPDALADFLTNKNTNIHHTLFTPYLVHPIYRRLAAYSTNLLEKIVEHRNNALDNNVDVLDDYVENEDSANNPDYNKVAVSAKIAHSETEVPVPQYSSESIIGDDKQAGHFTDTKYTEMNTSMEHLIHFESAGINPDTKDDICESLSACDKDYDAQLNTSVHESAGSNARISRVQSLGLSTSLASGSASLNQTLTASIASNKSIGIADPNSVTVSFINFLKDEKPRSTLLKSVTTAKQLTDVKRLGYFHLSALSSIISLMRLIDVPLEARSLILVKVCLCISLYETTSDHKEFFREYLANRILRLLLLMVEQRPQFATISDIVSVFFVCSTSKSYQASASRKHSNLVTPEPYSVYPLLQPLSAAIFSYFLSLVPHIILQSIYGRYALKKSGLLNNYSDFIGFMQVYPQCLGALTNLEQIFEFAILHSDTFIWFHLLKTLLVANFINISVENHRLIYQRNLLNTDGNLTIRIRNLTFIGTIDSLANGTIYQATTRFFFSIGEQPCINLILYLISKCTTVLQAYRVARLLHTIIKRLLLKSSDDNTSISLHAKTSLLDSESSSLSFLCRLCNALAIVSSQEVLGILSFGLVPLFHRYPKFIIGILTNEYESYKDSSRCTFPKQYGLLSSHDWCVYLLEQKAPDFAFEAILSILKEQASQNNLDQYAIPDFRYRFLEMKLTVLCLLLEKCHKFTSMGPYLSADYECEEIIDCIVHIYYIIRPPSDIYDSLSYTRYQIFAHDILSKQELYEQLLLLGVYVGHMSWHSLSSDDHKTRKAFIYSILSLSILNSSAAKDTYNEFIKDVESIRFESVSDVTLAKNLNMKRAPGFFVLNSWIYKVMAVFWHYTSYKHDFNTELHSTLAELKGFEELPVRKNGLETIPCAPVTDNVTCADEPLTLLNATNSLLATRDLDLPSAMSALTSPPLENGVRTFKTQKQLQPNRFGLLDCSLLCLLVLVGSNQNTILDYVSFIFKCYEWASSILKQTGQNTGPPLTLTLYACLFLLSIHQSIIKTNHKKALSSTCQLVNVLWTHSQRDFESHDHQTRNVREGCLYALEESDLHSDSIVSTTSGKVELSYLYPNLGTSESRLNAGTASSSVQPHDADEDDDALEAIDIMDQSTLYGRDIQVVAAPYLEHIITCLNVLIEVCPPSDLLDVVKSTLMLVLRHLKIRLLLHSFSSFLITSKSVVQKDPSFVRMSLIPAVSIPICYQTANESNLAHKILVTIFDIMHLDCSPEQYNRPVIDLLLHLYVLIYVQSDTKAPDLLKLFSHAITSEKISSYARCNLTNLLTSLVEASLFTAEEILKVIEKVLQGVRSERVASQCLISASKLLAI